MTRRSILPAICIVLASCGKKNSIPSGFLQLPKMQLVLWDMIRADALTTQRQKTYSSPAAMEENVKLQKQVFAIHNVTKEEFYQSLNYYETHPGLMRTLMDSVVNKANRERINNLPVNIPVNSPAVVK